VYLIDQVEVDGIAKLAVKHELIVRNENNIFLINFDILLNGFENLNSNLSNNIKLELRAFREVNATYSFLQLHIAGRISVAKDDLSEYLHECFHVNTVDRSFWSIL
jgi:hypothetical protein